MVRSRKNLPEEWKDLEGRLREVIRQNMGERRRTRQLLREAELKVEDQFGQIESLQSIWEITARKFRKHADSEFTHTLPPGNTRSNFASEVPTHAPRVS